MGLNTHSHLNRQMLEVFEKALEQSDLGPRFLTSDDVGKEQRILSVTKKCKLIGNKVTGVRALDTPGFSDTSSKKDHTVYQENLQIFRWIVHKQVDPSKNLRICRILYFLPYRGVPEKADGILQEEIKVMHYFFGMDVFSCMVIIATQEKRCQSIEFTDNDCELVSQVFGEAVEAVTGSNFTARPPVVYIGLNESDDDVLSKIKSADILDKEKFFVSVFQDGTCLRCACKIRLRKASSGRNIAVGVMQEDGELTEYEESKCHPFFIAKYSMAEKIEGGIKHIITFGIPYGIGVVTGYETWPWFNNCEEICPRCNKPPGSDGCCKILEKINVCDTDVIVTHTNQL